MLSSNLFFAASLILTSHLVFTYFYTVSLTWGPSMLPTISADGTTAVLISKRFRRGRDVRVGDLVSFAHPVSPGMRAIKRVVGLEGDLVVRDTPLDALPSAARGTGIVRCAGGVEAVDADADADAEAEAKADAGVQGGNEDHCRGRAQMMIQVPRGHVYVVGDNLHHSRDSRMFGPLPLALIKGKVTYTFAKHDWFWPRRVQSGLA